MNRRNFLSAAVLLPFFAQDLLAFESDIYVAHHEWSVFMNLRNRLHRIKAFVGYGNFNIIAFDEALSYAKNYPVIGEFTFVELSLIEKLFYEDPVKYGFYGERICTNLTDVIRQKDVEKVPDTGHYLFKGKPLNDYLRLKHDIGEEIVLTSGVRGVLKQLSLYMDKIYSCKGNISLASHSLAPPAYSYHSRCDFDVGKRGWGYRNFTVHFARTSEFRRLRELDYIDMRYTINNKEGVRYEPWHVKVI
jgi:hypothetical protein